MSVTTKDKMTNTTVVTPQTTISQVRRATLLSMIVIYSISAVFGIIAVFMPDFEWKIIATTALVGTGCLIVLCGLTVTNIPKWKFLTYFVNILGIAAVILSLMFLWDIIQYPSYTDQFTGEYVTPNTDMYTVMLNSLVLLWFWAFAGLSSALLVSASYNAGKLTKTFSYITIALIVLIFTISSSLLLFPSNGEDFGVIQFLIVCIILATLGFLITITVGLIQKAAKKTSIGNITPVVGNPAPVVTYFSDSPLVQASPEKIDAAFERIKVAATESNMPVDTYVDLLLKLYKMADSHDESLDY